MGGKVLDGVWGRDGDGIIEPGMADLVKSF